MLTEDQNEKRRFENDKTGYRIASSVGGANTGEGGDRIVCDDPHKDAYDLLDRPISGFGRIEANAKSAPTDKGVPI